MTTIPGLGPNWAPRVAGVLALFTLAAAAMPDTLPGAATLKPWLAFLGSLSTAILGFSTRQTNVSTEQATRRPVSGRAASPPPNPPTP